MLYIHLYIHLEKNQHDSFYVRSNTLLIAWYITKFYKSCYQKIEIINRNCYHLLLINLFHVTYAADYEVCYHF